MNNEEGSNEVGGQKNDDKKKNGDNGEVKPEAAEKDARAPAASRVEPQVAKQEARAPATKVLCAQLP